MTFEDIDQALRDAGIAFDIQSGRLADENDPSAHPTYCNEFFCKCAVVVATAHGLSAADVAAVLRTWLDTKDESPWRALVDSVAEA